MKKLLIIIFIINSISSFSQDYPMPPLLGLYGKLNCFGPPQPGVTGCSGSLDSIVSKDTLINSTSYRITSWESLFRNEGKQTYHVNLQNLTEEELIYDFDLQVNDTFLFPYSHEIFVVSERNVILLVNGEYRIELRLDNDEFFPLHWIEGVGDMRDGFYYQLYDGTPTDLWHNIVCFTNDYELIYKPSGFDYPCEDIQNYVYWDFINEVSEVKSISYPNPFSNSIKIQSNLVAAYKLTDLSGKVIKKGAENTIETTDVPKGIYVLWYKNAKGEEFSCKVVKVEE